MAVEKVKQIAEQARSGDATPEETWKMVCGVFRHAVELDERGLGRNPLAELVALLCHRSNQHFGLLPIYEILSIISALFPRLAVALRRVYFFFFEFFSFHAGLWHLIGNLYFLFIFGNSVEDYLGHTKFWAAWFCCQRLAEMFVLLCFDLTARICPRLAPAAALQE